MKKKDRPRAAFGFPWFTHRTVAQLDGDHDLLVTLDQISRVRRLTNYESLTLERLIKRSAQA